MNVRNEALPMEEEVGERWWLYLLLGVVAIIAGILAICTPLVTAVVVNVFVGVLLVVFGFVAAVHAVRSWRMISRALLSLLVAAFYVIAGLILLAYPVRGAAILTLVLGILFVVGGITRIINALAHRGLPNWGWELVGGILSLVLGVIIWSGWPVSTLWAISVIVGVDLIYAGWTMVMLSIMAHSFAGAGRGRMATQH